MANPRFYTYRDKVPLSGGASLGFRRGRGYFARPPKPSAMPYPGVPQSEDQIQREAEKRIAALMSSGRAPIESERARAQQRSEQNQKALIGLGEAMAKILGGVGPGMQAGYSQAAGEISSLAGGLSSATAERVRQSMQDNRDFASKAAPGSAPSDQAPSPDSLQDSLYALGGLIPSGSVSEQGAAARAWGEMQPAIGAFQMEQDFKAELGRANEEDDKYEQDLLDLAAKRPELRAQILDELRKREQAKLDARLSERQVRVQERAQGLYEKQFKEDKRSAKEGEKIKWAGLEFDTRKAAADAAAAAQEAELKGREVDAATSKLRGFLVDQYGRFIPDANGRRIPVVKEKKAPAKSRLGDAIQEARDLRGEPRENPEVTGNTPGRYLADPRAKGVFRRPRFKPTTNDPNKAIHDGAGYSFVEAQQYLMDVYGLKRAEARRALIRAGWKPDGQRSKQPGSRPPRSGR